MSDENKPSKRHRINIDVVPGFEKKLKLLAAKWGVKTNVALQRAIDQALARKWNEDERDVLLRLDTRVEEILRHIVP